VCEAKAGFGHAGRSPRFRFPFCGAISRQTLLEMMAGLAESGIRLPNPWARESLILDVKKSSGYQNPLENFPFPLHIGEPGKGQGPKTAVSRIGWSRGWARRWHVLRHLDSRLRP
jgi:hypothetical protein